MLAPPLTGVGPKKVRCDALTPLFVGAPRGCILFFFVKVNNLRFVFPPKNGYCSFASSAEAAFLNVIAGSLGMLKPLVGSHVILDLFDERIREKAAGYTPRSKIGGRP